MLRLIVFLFAVTCLVSCQGEKPSTPATPTPSGTPAATKPATPDAKNAAEQAKGAAAGAADATKKAVPSIPEPPKTAPK